MRNLHIGVFMIKSILFFWLCLLFSSPVLAEMSDQEKREFVETLAEPSKEKKVFYRWQTETSRKNLIEAGEITPQLHNHFMNMQSGIIAGPGLYVSEDLHSSSRFGDTIIQVEMDEGIKYIDLTDQETLSKLKQNGISADDIYKLNPKVAVKYTQPHWVFKAREGVTFQPFSSKGIPLSELDGSAMTKPFFRESIKQEVLKRAEKNLPTVIGSSLISILEEEHGEQYIRNAVIHHKDSLGNIDEVTRWLKHAGQYLNQNDIKNLINRAVLLPIDSAKQSASLLESMVQARLTKKANITEIVKKTPIKSIKEGTLFLQQINALISEKDKKIIADKAKTFPVHSLKEATEFIKAAPFLSIKDKEKMFSQVPIQSVDNFIQLTRGRYMTYIPSRSIKKMTRQIIPLINNVEEGGQILNLAGHYLEPADKKRIVDKVFPFITNATQGSQLLKNSELGPSDKKRIINKIVPLINKAKEGVKILSAIGDYLEPADKKRIARKTIPLIRTIEEGKELLASGEKYLSPEDKKRIVNKIIPLITSVKEGNNILSTLIHSLEPMDKKRIAKKTIPLVINAREGENLLNAVNPYLDPADKKKLVNRIISSISNIADGRVILSTANERLGSSDKKRIMNKIILLITNVQDGLEILENIDMQQHLSPADKKRIVNKIIPLINNARIGEEILSGAGKYLEPEDKKRIAKRILKFTGKSGIEDLKKLLTDEEHKDLVEEFKKRGRRKSKTSSHTDSDKNAERLKCLKKQLN